jgi:hypothetical protein
VTFKEPARASAYFLTAHGAWIVGSSYQGCRGNGDMTDQGDSALVSANTQMFED